MKIVTILQKVKYQNELKKMKDEIIDEIDEVKNLILAIKSGILKDRDFR